MKKTFLLFIIVFTSCNFERPTQFSELALKDTVHSINDTSFSIEEMLQKYKGKKGKEMKSSKKRSKNI